VSRDLRHMLLLRQAEGVYTSIRHGDGLRVRHAINNTYEADHRCPPTCAGGQRLEVLSMAALAAARAQLRHQAPLTAEVLACMQSAS
jgi:hypothetical protein